MILEKSLAKQNILTNNKKVLPIAKENAANAKHFNKIKGQLLDPLAMDLANKIQWEYLNSISINDSDPYPIAITGQGPPILLLHGFDSSFLEFRRLVPFLSKNHKLLIPDLFGFGFCPRPREANYCLDQMVLHLNAVLDQFAAEKPVGLIGASMGGALAMELARRHPQKVNRLLLLSPAGLTGGAMPIPRPLDQLGVWFLKQRFVRKALCRKAFADPINNVGPPEEQIASFHLNVTDWGRSLAAFARNGGLANCGNPLPTQPLHVIWGAQDKILSQTQKQESINLLVHHFEELEDCGHLPHIDNPKAVAERWLSLSINVQ